MNKKIVSFVLAMVLSVGLGVSSLYAATYLGSAVGDGYAAQNDSTGPARSSSSTAAGVGSESNGVWIKVGSTGDTLSGNLTAEFRYYAGIMTGYKQEGGKFVISDSFTSMKALLSNANNNWTVEYYAFTQADLASMPKPEDFGLETDENGEPKTETDANGNTHYVFKNKKAEQQYVKAMENWLKERGFSSEQLRVAQTNEQGDTEKYKKDVKDKNGNVIHKKDEIKYQSLSADFYVQLRSELAKGVNRTASISSGNGISGPTVTISDHRGPLYTFTSVNTASAMPEGYTAPAGSTLPSGIRVTSESDYYISGPLAGLVKGTKSYGLVATGETRETEDGGYAEKYEWKMTYSYSSYEAKKDANGVTYYVKTEFSAIGLDVKADDATINSAVQAVIKDYNNGSPKNDSDALGKVAVSQYSVNRYSNNDTLVSSYNSQKQNTTFYRAGKYETIVQNSEGTIISRYHYTANNVRVDVVSITGTGADSTAGYETSVCDKWGNTIGVMNGDYSGDKHDDAVRDIEKVKSQIANGDVVSLPSGTTVKTIYLTSADLRNATDAQLANYKKYFGWTDADITNMRNFDYGDSVVASIDVKYNEKFEDSTNTNRNGSAVTADGADVQTKTESTSAGTHTWHQTLGDSTSYSGWTFESTIMIGGAQAYKKTQDVIVSGTRTITIESDPAVTGSLYPSDEDIENLSDEDKEKMRAAGLDPDDKEAVREYLTDKKASELGVQKYKKDAEGNDTEELTDEYKLLQDGFYYDANTQKTYAVLSVSSIYVMDGSDDFHTVEGETILVDLGTTTQAEGLSKANEIKSKIGSDNKIMFMGTAGFGSQKGHLVLNMKSDWSGGYVTGDEIENVKQSIMEVSQQVYNAISDLQSQLQSGSISQEQYDKKVAEKLAEIKTEAEKEGYGWVVDNSEDNINKFLKTFGANNGGQFSWEGNGLTDVWAVLNETYQLF